MQAIDADGEVQTPGLSCAAPLGSGHGDPTGEFLREPIEPELPAAVLLTTLAGRYNRLT